MIQRWKPVTTSNTLSQTAARRTCGTTLVEVLVAFSLLATMVSVLTTAVVHHSRLSQTLRHERLAMDELSNQLELLTVLPDAELSSAAARLQPSEVVRASLTGVELKADVAEVDGGTRVTLQITWDAFGRRANPLRLTAWRYPSASEKAEDDLALTAPATPRDKQVLKGALTNTERRS